MPVDPLSVLAPVTGIVSGLSSFYNTFAQEQMNYEQIKLAREQMIRQEVMQRQQNEFAHREALDAWNRQVAYNSPLAQRRRLSAAGINPFSGQPAQYSPELSSQQAQPATAGITPVMPSLHTPPSPIEGVVDTLQGLAPMMKAIAEAKKVGVDTRLAELTMNDKVKQAGLQTEMQGFQNKLLEIQAKYVDTKEQAVVNNLLQDLNNKVQEAVLNSKEADLKDALIQVQQETVKNIRENTDLTNKNKLYLLKQLDTYDIMNELQQKLLRSQSYQAFQAGEASREQAQTTRELRPEQVTEVQQSIKDHKFGRAATILSKVMEAKGIGQSLWNGVYNWLRDGYSKANRDPKFRNHPVGQLLRVDPDDPMALSIEDLIGEFVDSEYYKPEGNTSRW